MVGRVVVPVRSILKFLFLFLILSAPTVNSFRPLTLPRQLPVSESRRPEVPPGVVVVLGRSRPFSRDDVRDSNKAASLILLRGSNAPSAVDEAPIDSSAAAITTTAVEEGFDLSTALFCGGLAFDAYTEPASNSSRWERGSRGLNVAFISTAFTRQLYKGLLRVTPVKCTGLPDDSEDDGAAERLMTGKGVDACVLVAAVEGSWKEDIELLEKELYHEGVLDLSGAAHVGRSSTAWSHATKENSEKTKRKTGRGYPYHVRGGWGSGGGQAVWPDEDPFYLYVQDPASVRLVFTILDDSKLGTGIAVGSTHKRLSELIPQAALHPKELIDQLKEEILDMVRRNVDLLDEKTKIQAGAVSWRGQLKMTSKPRKRDKNGQILAGAATGAYLAGPVGAAAGAVLMSFYEGQVRGTAEMKLQYLPIPQIAFPRQKYEVLGGLPGVNWGDLYRCYEKSNGRRRNPQQGGPSSTFTPLTLSDVDDLEHCFFVNHDVTGATCAVYRSLEKRLIVVSFRGTCAPVDLVTDASFLQDAWAEGDNVEDQSIPKVHSGFRRSMNSISRRLKELILACPGPGENINDYDMLVTGHSLGGALATLFVADIGQYGIDAGRGLPQLEPSEPWWKGIANTLMGSTAAKDPDAEPPRPGSLRLYNFGSPRCGNRAFAELFDGLLKKERGQGIDRAYRIVNGEDLVARFPRTMDGLVLGKVSYEHCAPTVLISQPRGTDDDDDGEGATASTNGLEKEERPLIWIEGESDDDRCPVRDGDTLVSPTEEGSLLGDLLGAFSDKKEQESALTTNSGLGGGAFSKLSDVAGRIQHRLAKVTATDVASVVGVDREFAERELGIARSIVEGKALAHHMEDEYYAGMGRASGFLARVGEDIVDLDP